MKVLFLSQIVPYPPHGGVLQRGYNLLRELGRSDTVHLLAYVHPDTLPTPSALDDSLGELRRFCASVEYFRLWPKVSRFHRLTALAASAASRQPFSVIAHRSAAFRRRVRALLGSTAFDVIHVDTLALWPFVRERRGVPAVLTHHNIESQLMARRAEAENNGVARAFLRREARKLASFELRVARSVEVNVTVSDTDGRNLASRAPGIRAAVVPNGVDVEYFSPGHDSEAPSFIYTGGMNMFANRDAVLHFASDVWPLITSCRPDATFYAVGQDPPQELLDLARRDRRIVVTGYVPDIRPLVRQASVYVVPLRVGGGTRLKVLDAMAMGKAIVTTSIGCEGLEVSNGDNVLVADSPETFARTALDLLADPDRRRALGAASRTLVERRYAWSVVGAALRNAYLAAIAARKDQA